MASKRGEEVLVSPKASLAPPVLHHRRLPEQCQQSLPGRARLTPTEGCYAPGDSGIIPVLQEMWGQGCCHKPSPSASTLQLRARAALWLETLLTPGKNPSAPAQLLDLLPKHLLLTTARHRGTRPFCSQPSPRSL